MPKNILIINGHPDEESYNFALAKAYKKGAEKSKDSFRKKWLRKVEKLGERNQ